MILQSTHAATAAEERDSRERGYPRLIEAGKITAEEAGADLAAWRALAEIFGRGSAERNTSWSALHLATSRCLLNLEAAVERTAAGDPDKLRKLTARRDAVASLHAQVENHKFMIDDTSAILRERARRTPKAA